METWKLSVDHKKEVLGQVLHEVELEIDWIKEFWVVCEEYKKLMMEFDVPAIELYLK